MPLLFAISLIPVAVAAPVGEESTPSFYDTVVVARYVPYEPLKPSSSACSCVNYVKERLGISDVWGYPNKVELKPTAPYIGGVVFTTEGYFGHVALITGISSQSLTVIEANYVPCQITSRSIALDAEFIRGYQ